CGRHSLWWGWRNPPRAWGADSIVPYPVGHCGDEAHREAHSLGQLSCGEKWLAPFFTPRDRIDQAAGLDWSSGGGQPHLRRCAALDTLDENLLHANRTIGQHNKITAIFGRRLIRIIGPRCKARWKAWTCPSSDSPPLWQRVHQAVSAIT